MKKLAVALFVAFMAIAFAAPAYALENEFGGYFRIRMFDQTDFDGRDGVDGVDSDGDGALEHQDTKRADSRTRLYYTAVINDNLKFVNKFEMDANWGGAAAGYGDLGADGVSVEVKNTYIDFNYGPANVKAGTHYGQIGRGFIMANDFSGITVTSGGFTGVYGKIEENGDSTSNDSQMYAAVYTFKMNELSITPNLTFFDINDLDNDGSAVSDDTLYYLGVDVDGSAAGFDYWATFIYNGGEVESNDVGAYLFAFGGSMALNEIVSIHGQFFTATGDEDGTGDMDDFQVIPGTGSYYWSEIMGYGVFDNQVSAGSPADAISNITAFNLGIKYQATNKLTLGADLWYAVLDEDNAQNEDELGTEIDLSARYEIIPGLLMHASAAYLFAGDATSTADGTATTDETNAYEIGTQFSISF